MAKRIVLGVSASIAAYKAAELASRLTQAGIDVYPILTRDACRFIQPAVFSALTSHPCPVDVFDDPFPGEIAHIWLGKNCDLFVIAPGSMNLLAQLAHGLTPDMLTASASACSATIMVAPSMNSVMWESPANQANLQTLRSRGVRFIEPHSGQLACNTQGVGRMAEPEEIFEAVQAHLSQRESWRGVRVLVTAGPTREGIDPVRYISNRSSGKMGYALAEAARDRGAEVTLLSGPVALAAPSGIKILYAETAAQMHKAALECAKTADYIIAAAAVADFAPIASPSKLKKEQGAPQIAFARTPDILADLGRGKPKGQILIGFAAETENLLSNAQRKLSTKNLDWIVANDVSLPHAGFNGDENIAVLLASDGSQLSLPRMKKRKMAGEILDAIRPGA